MADPLMGVKKVLLVGYIFVTVDGAKAGISVFWGPFGENL